MSSKPCRSKAFAFALIAVVVMGVSAVAATVPASAVVAKPAPVLTISNASPRVGEVVTLSNTGTCPFGNCNDNLKWFPVPMAGSHFGTQIATVRGPATAVPYSWSSPGNKQIILTSNDGQSRLCCSGTASIVITVLPSLTPPPPPPPPPTPLPATTPDAPTMNAAAPGDGYAFVSFSAPSSDGRSPITGYTVTASPGGATATGTSTVLTVTGLTNGTTYTFTVHATNAVGNSGESAASNPVTPASVPGAPTIGSATAGGASATVSFTAPSSNGGNAITGYTVTASPGGATASAAASPITVKSLSGGVAYTFTVHATNAAGNSAESAPSNAVTPTAFPTASIFNANATETNGLSTLLFTVSLSAPATEAVTVRYATANSTATAPADYIATSGTLTFAVGEQTKAIPVTIVGDTVHELAERFFVNLISASGATIVDSKANGNITDDDPA